MTLTIALFIALVIFVNFLLWRLFLPWAVSRRISGFQNDFMSKFYNEINVTYRKMQEWRHDYHNHIQVLKANLIFQQYGQAMDYLDKLEKDLTTVDTVLKTGNVMVDAILNSKLSLMQEKKISVDATASLPDAIVVSETDLSVLIGNILDNAIEACMKIPHEKERFIRIYMDIVKQQLYIYVANSMEKDLPKTHGSFLSGKQGAHGFGLPRIDSIVAKYNGFLNRQTEPGVFATEIMLPLIEK